MPQHLCRKLSPQIQSTRRNYRCDGISPRRSKYIVCIMLEVALVFCNGQTISPQSMASNEAGSIPTFSITSVRPSDPKATRGVYQITPDGIVERNNSVLWLIEVAYGISMADRVIGAPSWTEDERYDVLAKVNPSEIVTLAGLSSQQRGYMLKSVLEERFHIRAHYENRELPEFALTISKKGPKLEPSQPIGSTQPEHLKYSGHYVLTAKSVSMPELCSMLLSTEARRMVVDETGLIGKYDFTLRWSRENADNSNPTAVSTGDAPGIFTAIKEQLGLQMVTRRVPGRVLVVDHVERPSTN